jgi:hypothetical protein
MVLSLAAQQKDPFSFWEISFDLVSYSGSLLWSGEKGAQGCENSRSLWRIS